MKIVFATNNEHKLSEIRSILKDKIEVLSLSDIDCHVDIPETGETLEENALQKAQYIYDHYHMDVFADDTGLEVEALGGAPGVHTARYADEVDHDAEANTRKLLREMAPFDNRKARFRTAIALIISQHSTLNTQLFEGIVNGEITREKRGEKGFGYDPVFIPEGYNETFAELGVDVKNQISHRARAVQKLVKYLSTLLLCLFTLLPLNAQIGTWRNYLAYSEVQNICAADGELFVQASNALYTYNLNDQSITTYDKVNGLSDTYITHIKWNSTAKRLLIIYQNQNMDLMDLKGNVTNISDLHNKLMIGDKTVNSIRMDGIYAYLVCGFGIVKVNMQRAEIADSYTPNHPEYPTSLPAEDNSDFDKYIDLVKTLKPGGPHTNHFGFMIFNYNRLYSCNGDYNNSSPIQILNNNEWTIYQYEDISEQTGVSFQGSFCLDIDPSNIDHVFAGSRNGLYEYLNGKFVKYYDKSNSPIEPFDGVNKDYQLVTGTKYDQQGNLWVLNSSAPNTALIKYSNGTFTKLNHSELMKLNRGNIKNRSNGELSKIIIDSKGKMWFVNNNWVLPAIYQYNTDNDEIIAYESIVNQDGTRLYIQEGIRCVAEDLEHNIWVGTSVGPVMLESSEIANGGNTFTQIKVPRNDGTNYADYLLANIDISSIAIDGGNRKWIGTFNNGVYLISADNITQVQHFTANNSPLLSDMITSIAINHASGEVFFGTDKGLCSYISDATAPANEMTEDNVYAYPNPVTPDYNGLITIVGLSYDADVKILSTNGSIIAEGRSTGGTFTWNGCDQKGRRVASGVYMVATATSKGEKGIVCKIAIVR